jgi:hypothetical protein
MRQAKLIIAGIRTKELCMGFDSYSDSAVAVFGFPAINGARRWIRFPGFHFNRRR